MKIIFFSCCLVVVFSFIVACGPVPEMRYADSDLTPPQYLKIKTLASEKLEISFNEAAQIKKEELSIEPVLAVTDVQNLEQEARILVFTGEQTVGQAYKLTARVEDVHKNSLTLSVSFYGYNPQIPSVVINEFITYGSSTHPDLVELKVLEKGNLGGLVLYEGTPGNYDDFFIFPAVEVVRHDFVLIHFKPQELAVELNETTARQISGGLDASPEAYDFWIKGGDGLSGNNGVLSIWESPGGNLLDGVIYSNRTSYSDEMYGGFGAEAAWQQARELAAEKGWQTEAAQVRPEDAVNPTGSTSTRSLCRNAGPDTDSKADWHIVPTRQATFGKENSPEVYIPPVVEN